MKRPWQDYMYVGFILIILLFVSQCTHAGELDRQGEQQQSWENRMNTAIITIDKSQEKQILTTFQNGNGLLLFMVRCGILSSKIQHGKIQLLKIRWR